VDDLIEGFLRFMQLDAPFAGPINLGNPNEFTIVSLAEQVISLTGSRSRLVYAPLPSDDPLQRRPDISLAREKLQWEPTVQLREGLTRTIAYFDELLKSGH
jgi:UDP-glucuronate decarboxylase